MKNIILTLSALLYQVRALAGHHEAGEEHTGNSS